MNAWKPFLYNRDSYKLGLIAQLLYNRPFTQKEKHKAKTAVQLFRDLSDEVPEEFEDDRIVKCRRALANISGGSGKLAAKGIAFINEKIAEEIELERGKDDPDWYVISRLSQLIDGDKHA